MSNDLRINHDEQHIALNDALTKLEPFIRKGTVITTREHDAYTYINHGQLDELPAHNYADEQDRLAHIARVLSEDVVPNLNYDADLADIQIYLDNTLWIRITGCGLPKHLSFVAEELPDLYDDLHSDVYPLVTNSVIIHGDELYAMLILVKVSERDTPVIYDPDFQRTPEDKATADELLRRCSQLFPINIHELNELFPLD